MSNTIYIKDARVISQTDEGYKTLRTNLLYTEDLKVIALTSTVPNEGKTTTSINLARSFVQIKKKVLLIDCDLRKGSLRHYLPKKGAHYGLTELILGQVDNPIYKTNIENLYILYSGKIPPNPSEMLTGPQFKRIIDLLRKEFDYIIIDTPPMTATSDAAIIGRIADGMIIVVGNDFVKKNRLKRIKVELERNHVRLIGAVLTRVKKYQVDYSQYEYYGKYDQE